MKWCRGCVCCDLLLLSPVTAMDTPMVSETPEQIPAPAPSTTNHTWSQYAPVPGLATLSHPLFIC